MRSKGKFSTLSLLFSSQAHFHSPPSPLGMRAVLSPLQLPSAALSSSHSCPFPLWALHMGWSPTQAAPAWVTYELLHRGSFQWAADLQEQVPPLFATYHLQFPPALLPPTRCSLQAAVPAQSCSCGGVHGHLL